METREAFPIWIYLILLLCIAYLVLTAFLHVKTGDGWNWKWFFSKSFREGLRLQNRQMDRIRYFSSDSVRQTGMDGEEVD